MAEQVDTHLVINIIKLIQQNPRTSKLRMGDELGVSESTISRNIDKARKILNVDFTYVRSPEVDDPGWWEVRSYGVLDPKLFESE